ncbi:crotonase/enoyl-CoA hydratase family protein [Spirosoma luteolum]
MEQTYQSVNLTANEGILTVTLLGPGKGNAMGPEFWDEFPQLMTAVDQMADIRCVIVRGSGEHFSYGLNLPQMMPKLSTLTQGERTVLTAQIRQMQTGFQRLYNSPKPVIAAIHGWCIGGGVNLIAAADIRLCSRDARFSLREAKLAMTPDIGGLQFLPAIIGQGFTREMAYTGNDYDAAFAERIGLVNHVYDTPDSLFEAATALARQIAANSATAVSGAKKVLNQATDEAIREGLAFVAELNSGQMQSSDFSEAMQATLERRQAEFNRKSNRGY